MDQLNRPTTLDFLSYNQCGTKHENKRLNKIKNTRLKKENTYSIQISHDIESPSFSPGEKNSTPSSIHEVVSVIVNLIVMNLVY